MSLFSLDRNNLPISLGALLRCCERELAFRRRVYPRLISENRLSEHKAKTEIELMEACVEHFRSALESGRR